jgi:hypothetical protein
MTTPATQPRSTQLAWILALVTSWLGAAILFDAFPGINWPIWVAVASVSLILSRFSSAGRVQAPLIVLTAWATVLSIAFALTANDFLQFLIVLADAMLLGLATITLGAPTWGELSAKLLVTVPILAPLRVAGATANEAASAPRSFSSPRTQAIVKGSLLSIPVVIVLVVLLSSADPVIGWSTDRIAAWLPDWSFPPRILFFVFLLTLTLGANALAIRQLAAKLPQYSIGSSRFTLGLTEQRMMLWSAAVVLWLFVALQVSYFIHPPPAAVGTGVTFAEFARRGFGQLSFAVTLVGVIIIVLEYARPVDISDRDRSIVRRLEFSLLIALELVLISAFRRVILYEQAYGFTEDRVFAQLYMVGMALAVAALAWEIRREAISISFGRRVAEIALATFTFLVFWNYEAWIVNRNVDRAATTGKVDAWYLTRLPRDATPTLLARLPDIPEPQRDTVSMRMACKGLPVDRRWFEWNRNTAAAANALKGWTHPPCEAIVARFPAAASP